MFTSHRPGLRALIVGLFATLTLQIALATDRPEMTWAIFDLPPSMIVENGRPEGGISGEILKLLMKEWPEVEHSFQVVTYARSLENLAKGYKACSIGLIPTPEREKFAYFTVTALLPPLQLVTRSDVFNKLPMNEKGEVLAANLFDRPDLRGILGQRRSYNALVDTLVTLRSDKSGLIFVTPVGAGSNILRMVGQSRGDYTIEYDFILTYQQKNNADIALKNLKLLPIAGLQGTYTAVACPRTEWGLETIKKVDQLLVGLTHNAEYKNVVSHWITADSARRLKKLQEEFLRNRSNPTNF